MPRTPAKFELALSRLRRKGDDEIDCDDVFEDSGEETGEGQGSDHDRIWDFSKREAEDLALGAATKAALALDCPEECRHRLLDIQVGPASDPVCKRVNNANPPPKREWNCKAKAPWSVEVRCVNLDKLKKKGTIPQDPDRKTRAKCGEKYYNKGTVTGKAENANRGKAADKAREEAVFHVTSGVYVGSDIVKIHCPSKCPVKNVQLLLSEPTVPHCKQQANGNYVCTVKIDFAYIVECVEEEEEDE